MCVGEMVLWCTHVLVCVFFLPFSLSNSFFCELWCSISDCSCMYSGMYMYMHYSRAPHKGYLCDKNVFARPQVKNSTFHPLKRGHLSNEDTSARSQVNKDRTFHPLKKRTPL